MEIEGTAFPPGRSMAVPARLVIDTDEARVLTDDWGEAVGARVRWQYDRPWAAGEARAGRLVVIAEHDAIDRGAIAAALAAETAA